MAELTATAGNDIFHGTDGVDFFSDNLGGDDEFYGEAGNDILYASRSTGQTGSVLLDGGADQDRITFASDYLVTNVVLRGGGGNDLIQTQGGATVAIDAGAGADILAVSREGTSYTIALGAGADVVGFSGVDFTWSPGPAMVFTDFEVGAGGDRLALDRFLAKFRNWDSKLNPFAVGHLALVQQGADAVLRIDRDAQGSGYDFVDFAIFRNVAAASLTAANLGFAPDGGLTPGIVLAGTADDDRIYGAGGADEIDGGGGSDEIDGGTGNDLIHGGAGNDRIEGQLGDDQVFGGADADIVRDRDGGDDQFFGEGGGDILEIGRNWASQGDIVLLDGGDGADSLYFFGLSSNRVHRLTFNGGTGNDDISIDTGVASAVIDAGEGNDTLHLVVNDADFTITLGAGADEVDLGNYNFARLLPVKVRFTDFQAGLGGDDLEFSTSMLKAKLDTWDGITDPFSIGLLRLAQRGATAFIQSDRNGDGQGFETLITFSNLIAASLVAANLHGFQPGSVTALGGGDETIVGGDGPDTIEGLGGNDILAGAGGADTLDGGEGNDTLYAAGITPPWQNPFFGNNTGFTPPILDVGSEIDILRGGAGYDQIFAGYGDVVDGGADYADLYISLQGSSAGLTVDFRQLANGGTITIGGGTITNIRGVRWIEGTNYDDTLTGSDSLGYQNASNAPIFGRGGNDHLIAGQNSGNLYGGDGNDTLETAFNTGFLYGEAGDDVITNMGVQTQSYGGDGNDTLITRGGAHGGAGNDIITLDDIYPYLAVGYGDEGDDTIDGSNIQSTIAGGAGADIIRGNDGNDLLFSAGPGSGLSPNVQGSEISGEADFGTEHDQLSGGEGNDRLSIGYGDDADGGAGFDSLALSLYGAGSGMVIDTADIISGASYVIGGGTIRNMDEILTLWGSNFGDTITLAEQATGLTVFGEGGDDTINGTSKADVIHGGAGADIVNAGAGNDTIYIDSGTDGATGEQLNGGEGFDTLRVDFSVDTADLSGTTLTGIESIVAGGAEILVATTTLAGIGSLDGTFRFTNGGTVSLGTITSGSTLFFGLSAAGNTIDLTNISGLSFLGVFGGDGNDVIVAGSVNGGNYSGGGGDDLLISGARGDQFNGEDGIDTVDYRNAASGIVVTLATTAGQPGSGTGGDLLFNVENINGSAFNDTLNGNNDANSLRGSDGIDTLNARGGNDLLDGGAGADIMRGGTGDDAYVVDAFADQVIEASGEGNDAVYTDVSYQLGAGQSVETLAAQDNSQTVALNLFGNELNNVLFGNNGANFLDGGAGADILTGFGGDDIYAVDNAGEVVVEDAGQGNDAIYTTFSYQLGFGSSVETLAARDNTLTSAMNLFGNELNNTIFGNNGANFLDGGLGADILTGFGGDDIYAVDNAGEVVVEDASQGNDAIYTTFSYILGFGSSVELLAARDNTLTSAMSLFGNELNNTILGNNGANYLDGFAGADVMAGYSGDDTYVVDNAGDQILEDAGRGNDAVYTGISFVLGAGASVETLAAGDNSLTVALNLTGNELGQGLLGNNGANTLDGKGAADTLFGFGGADTFQFTTAIGTGTGNVDLIADFVSGTDKIALDDAIFAGLTPGALAAGAFVKGTAAADADDRIVYDSATGQLFYDADGNGAGAAILFATLQGNPVLTAGDFTII